jgi:hypothetical protein
MGLEKRKRSGNLIGGSRLVVPGQNIYNVKKFEPSFNKKGSEDDETMVIPPIPPIPPITTTTTTIIPIETCNIETQQYGEMLTESFDNLIWC